MNVNIINHTPYINLGKTGRPDIFLKLECNQFGRSFKARGITNFLKHTENVEGLVTYTTGNHGIAIADIAKAIGVKAVIISSNKLTKYKRDVIESLGATVQLVDFYNIDQATSVAREVAARTGFTFVPLFGNQHVLDGYSKIADEICADFTEELSAFFPVGSGSLLLANAKRIKECFPHNKVIGVEPAIYQRLNGMMQYNRPSHSIADSLSINEIPKGNMVLTNYADQLMAIDERSIADATKLIFDEYDMLVEPSGAITLAAALQTPADDRKKIAVITGKNISLEQFDLFTKTVTA